MKASQKIHSFTLVLKNVDEDTPGLEDRLYESGCDDSLVNFRDGTVYLDFDRKAVSFEKAVISAIRQVETTGAMVVSVAPEDLVSESDIAKRLQVKRQTVSLWVKGARRKENPFPKPIMKLSDRSPFWKWREVTEWLYQHHLIKEEALIQKAAFIENLNVVLEERDIPDRKLRKNLTRELSQPVLKNGFWTHAAAV